MLAAGTIHDNQERIIRGDAASVTLVMWRSPAIHLVFGATVGGVSAICLRGIANPQNYEWAVWGWLFGGLIYRWRARSWPRDQTAIRKALAVCTWFAAFLCLLMSKTYPNYANILKLLMTFGAVPLGALFCGFNRHPSRSHLSG